MDVFIQFMLNKQKSLFGIKPEFELIIGDFSPIIENEKRFNRDQCQGQFGYQSKESFLVIDTKHFFVKINLMNFECKLF